MRCFRGLALIAETMAGPWILAAGFVVGLDTGQTRRAAGAIATWRADAAVSWPLLLMLVVPPREQTAGACLADIWQLDVGQGLAIRIRTRNHAVLNDTGPRFVDFSDLGEAGGVCKRCASSASNIWI